MFKSIIVLRGRDNRVRNFKWDFKVNFMVYFKEEKMEEPCNVGACLAFLYTLCNFQFGVFVRSGFYFICIIVTLNGSNPKIFPIHIYPV